MNLEELNRKLVATARANPPSEAVPYAFEKRIMARLRATPRLDEWAQWSRALWRAAAPCLAVTLLLTAWAYFSPAGNAQTGNGATTDLSQEIENTLLAAVDQDPPAEIIQ